METMKYCSAIFFIVCFVGCNQKSSPDQPALDVTDTRDDGVTDEPDEGATPDTTPTPDAEPAPDEGPTLGPKYCSLSTECGDDTPCTMDFCQDNVCQHVGQNGLCGDNDPCSKDICYSGAGCVSEPDDGRACDAGLCAMAGVCFDGGCQAMGAVSCEDMNPCTNDTCDPALGCDHSWNSLPCNDGDEFTMNDVCSGGACVGTPKSSMSCNTQADCMTDNACAKYMCMDGKCLELTGAGNCDDGVSCTVDSCDVLEGCKHVALESLCDKGSWCDASLGCMECWNDWQCEDENVCTGDYCLDGTCYHEPYLWDYWTHNYVKKDGKPVPTDEMKCDDNDVCTTVDFCDTGVCEGHVALNCDDLVSCTKDWCDPEYGCFNEAPTGCAVPSAPPTPPAPSTETCNGLDDDEDGLVDNGTNVQGCTKFYWDADGDGYGKPGPTCLCAAQSKWTATIDSDCNDANTTVYKGASEACDFIDNDCDLLVDEGCPNAPLASAEKCGDNVDNDLDGLTDEEGSTGCTTFFYDSDSDGYGAPSGAKCFCAGKQPTKWILTDSDCDDLNAATKPGVQEVCGDAKDNNCNGLVDDGCPPAGGSSGAGSGSSGSSAAKACTLRVITTQYPYQLNGTAPQWSWPTNVNAASQPACNNSWCEGVATLVTTSNTTKIVANAQCPTGILCGGPDKTWGVADTNWQNGCTVSELVQVAGVFDASADCDCAAACFNSFPNLICGVK